MEIANETKMMILQEALKTNLNLSDFPHILEFVEMLRKAIETTAQDYIDKEQKEFESEHKNCGEKRIYKHKRKTILGTIELKVAVYRNAEFKSKIIATKARNFCLETYSLLMLLYTGKMSYDHIFIVNTWVYR